jgi:hypothetical protein
MLRFRLVRFAPVVTAAMVGGIVIASAAPALAQTKAPMGAATPQAALDTLEAAIPKGDVAAAMGVMTPSGRKEFVRDLSMQTLMFFAFMDPDDPMPGGAKEAPDVVAKKKKAYAEAKAAVTAAFKPSGMDAALGKPVMTAKPIIDAGIEKADLLDVASKTYAAVAKVSPMFGNTKPGPLPLPIKVGPFTALKVDGSTATVKSGPKTLKFEQTDGKWYLNFPLPEPDGPPQP